MKLHSDSFEHRGVLPVRYAAGKPDADGYGFADNRNPHLSWTDVPAGTQSFVLWVVDTDVPTRPEMAGVPDIEIPLRQARTEFTHWIVVDIDATTREIVEAAHCNGVTAKGKAPSAVGPGNGKQGLNDYTGWFATDPDMAGDWHGYDGAFPPPNDQREHRYFFRLFALDVPSLNLPERYTADQALRAMRGHILAEDAIYATYSLHPKLHKAL